MKRKIIFAVLILLFPMIAFADSITLECPKAVAPNSEFTCKIVGNTSMKVSGISAKVKVNDSLELVSVITDKIWQGDGKYGDIQLYSADDITGKFNIGTIRLKSIDNENNSILIHSIVLYDDDVKSHQLESVSATINVDNNAEKQEIDSSAESNRMIDLKIDNYDVLFDGSSKEYVLEIGDEEKLNIKPVLEDDTATYKIEGNENLKNGSKVKIKIKTGNSEENVYILKIVKTKTGKNVAMIFIIVIMSLLLINMARIISKKTNRGKKK